MSLKRMEVEWLDARMVYEQLEISEAIEKCQLSKRITIGYLVHRDRERLLICHTFDPAEKKLDRKNTPDEDGGADFTVIPRGWAVRITELVEDKEEEQPHGESAS